MLSTRAAAADGARMHSLRALPRRAALAGALLLALGAAVVLGAALAAHAPRAGAAPPAAARRTGAAGASGSTARAGAPAVYWGAWIGSQLTGAEAPWDFGAVRRFESLTRRPLSLVSFASPFADCASTPCTAYAFPRRPFAAIRANGAIPFLSWSSASLPVSALESGYTLRDVAAGRFDAYISRWAAAAREWGHPFFLRFDWEMNSSGFPWSLAVNGGDPAAYVAAWRHVHDIFARAGARNASWVWCPNAEPERDPGELAALYPGSPYVDWTCLDGYNQGAPWRSFQQIFGADYAFITGRLAPQKPMIIGETASTESGGSKAAWIAGMFAELRRMPRIRGLIWFERNTGGVDWPAESSASSLQALSLGLAGGSFAGSSYAALRSSPIPPPRRR